MALTVTFEKALVLLLHFLILLLLLSQLRLVLKQVMVSDTQTYVTEKHTDSLPDRGALA